MKRRHFVTYTSAAALSACSATKGIMPALRGGGASTGGDAQVAGGFMPAGPLPSIPLLGEVRRFDGNAAPAGWALCDGRLLSVAQNPKLFAILGKTSGGDGKKTFALPASGKFALVIAVSGVSPRSPQELADVMRQRSKTPPVSSTPAPVTPAPAVNLPVLKRAVPL